MTGTERATRPGRNRGAAAGAVVCAALAAALGGAAAAWPADGTTDRRDFTWKSVRHECPAIIGVSTSPTSREITYTNSQYSLPSFVARGCKTVVDWELKSGFRGTAYGTALMNKASSSSSARVWTDVASGSQQLGTPTKVGDSVLRFTLPGTTRYPAQITLKVDYDATNDVYPDPIWRKFVVETQRQQMTRVIQEGGLQQIGGGTPPAAPAPPSPPAAPTYSWTVAITQTTLGNLTEPIGTRLGTAEDLIQGHSISQIVRDPTVKVRADNKACQECHGSVAQTAQFRADTVSRAGFCGRVADFNAASKPSILKNLFNNWSTRNCPN
jgi:hypothetical protein